MNSIADYQPFLAQRDATAPIQSYRIDLLEPWGWCVRVHGHYVAEFDTLREAERWLAGFLLAASTTPETQGGNACLMTPFMP